MEITERAESRGLRKYKVLKRFQMKLGNDKTPRILEPGEEINLTPQEEKEWALGYVTMCRLEPILPEVAQYRALRSFKAVVGDEAIEIDKDVVVELRAQDAFKRIMSREVIPVDKDVWCPFTLRRRVPQHILKHALKGDGIAGLYTATTPKE